MKFSYSRVSCYKSCPRQFQYRYLERLETLPNTDANNALYLGSAMHEGIEKDVNAAVDSYFSNYPVIDDLHINEVIKLEHLIPLAKKVIPAGEHEVKIDIDDYGTVRWDGETHKPFGCGGFIGFIDLLVPKGDNHFDIYDFKYSNNVERYMQSEQLHVYKYFYEMTHEGHMIDNLYYVFVPKTMIRQKKTEDLFQFRERLLATLNEAEVRVLNVEYDPQKVTDYLAAVEEIKATSEYPKVESRLCDFCQYKEYCIQGETYMMLPKNERRELGTNNRKVIWLYGAPFSGKTCLTDKFPDPLMLNTDGNIGNVTAPYLPIKDEVTVDGRITKRKDAWIIFKEIIEELEKKQNDFKTIVVDLLEDVYEHCRAYKFKELGIKHESDASFGKGYDMVRKEFLDTIKRLTTLDYENIILISHEDSSSAITTMTGASQTKFKPNIQDKIASKVAGMVGVVARVVANGDNRKLSFKSNEYIFGGGRLANIRGREIKLDYDELILVYKEASAAAPERRETK